MAKPTTELLSTISAMQTLVEYFPMGGFRNIGEKTYNSTTEFMLDVLRQIGITDKELLNYLFKDILGVNDIGSATKETMQKYSNKLENSKFVNSVETSTKSLFGRMLADIISCSVYPTIPDRVITEGVGLPLGVIDPYKLLDISPASKYGQMRYTDIPDGTKPQELSGTTNMDAFMWYILNMTNPSETGAWVSPKDRGTSGATPVCLFSNRGYKELNVKIPFTFLSKKGEYIHTFNSEYLNSIKIFSAHEILTNILDQFMNGMPNAEVNFGFDEIYSEATFKKMVRTIIKNDDLGVDDCYYKFSNEEWLNALEDTELKKYDAKKTGRLSKEARRVDKSIITDALNAAAGTSSAYDRTQLITDAIIKTATPSEEEIYVLTEEGGTNRRYSFEFNTNSMWLENIILDLVTPFAKCLFNPKVMTLLYLNYDMAGAINLSKSYDKRLPTDVVIEGLKRKMLGMMGALVRLLKDRIIEALLSLFKKKALPLISKYTLKRLMEESEFYLELLSQALECISLFRNRNARTSIDDVDYADIYPVKNNPQENNCYE